MHLPVLRLLRGAALLLPILGTPAARAGLICDEPDGSARFSSALALNAYLAEIGIDAARDRIALAEGRSGDNSCQRRRKNQPNGGAKVCQFWWGFLVRLEAVSSSRPDVFGASRTAAVKDGRRPPRSGAQRP